MKSNIHVVSVLIVVVVNNRCLGVGLRWGPMDARGFGEGLCTEKHTREDEHTHDFTQVRVSREEIKPLLLLVWSISGGFTAGLQVAPWAVHEMLWTEELVLGYWVKLEESSYVSWKLKCPGRGHPSPECFPWCSLYRRPRGQEHCTWHWLAYYATLLQELTTGVLSVL